MMETTMFHAKKILTRRSDGWDFDINLLFDGFEDFMVRFLPVSVFYNLLEDHVLERLDLLVARFPNGFQSRNLHHQI